MTSVKALLTLLFRFFATTIGMAMNMKRIISTKGDSVDDMFFILSIIFGLFIGIYWDKLIGIITN